jgi:hypothetical protein
MMGRGEVSELRSELRKVAALPVYLNFIAQIFGLVA